MKIKAFTKHNPEYESYNHPKEDSFRYLLEANKLIAVVADGITRDPTGIKNFPQNLDKKTIEKISKKYPRPSPAKIASDLFCDSIIKKLSHSSLEQSLKYANEQIKLLNKRENPIPDYLENDFWACVGSCGTIENNFLNYGYVCDCGVCVFDKFGKLKFRTEDDGPNKHHNDIWKSSLLEGKKWSEAEARKIIRSHFRNNPKEKYSYGAFTGEKSAMNFVKIGKIPFDSKDYILFYSDGFAKIIFSSKFDVTRFDFFEEYFDKNSREIDGSEGTAVAIHMN